MLKKLFFILVGLLSFSHSFPQEAISYPSWDDFYSDVKSRNFEKPILFLKQNLSEIESESNSSFPDSVYIGMTTVLTSIYIQCNRPYAADSLLNHSITYLLESKKTSRFAYALYLAYGGLLTQLQNYNLAIIYLSSARDYLKANDDKSENYAVTQSMLALCHLNVDSIEIAKHEIDESMDLIELSNSMYTLSNKMSIYQKASAIYYELGLLNDANKYMQIAYELSKDDDRFVTEFISSALNMSISLMNQGRYSESLEILHQLEQKPLTDSEHINVCQNIYLANYFLNDEAETVKYANLSSDYIQKISSDIMSSFPVFTIEDLWQKSAMQLKINMGILEKYHSNALAVMMSYNNALYLKNYSFSQMKSIRDISQKNDKIRMILDETKRVKSALFSGNASYYNDLNTLEKELIKELKEVPDREKLVSVYTWEDVKKSLKPNECAIEIVSFSGFVNSETKDTDNGRLKYGALILTSALDTPLFVNLCSYKELYDVLINALEEKEIGINELYKKNNLILYNLIWSHVKPYLSNIKTIYWSPALDMQDINMGFVPCPNGKYVNDDYDIQIVSSTSIICNESHQSELSRVSIYGGIKFSKSTDSINSIDSYRGVVLDELNNETRGDFGYLKATEIEADSIYALIRNYNIDALLYKGDDASESSFRNLDGKPTSIIHMATHGFYLDGYMKYADYFNKLIPYSLNNSSMLLSGLLLADANSSLNESNGRNVLNDGVLTAEEISWIDLSNTQLAVLSACETAIGRSFQEGIGGLLKAFKNAGVEHIVASLWKVPDSSTSKLMVLFYRYLLSGDETHNALLKAQKETSHLYPDPYYWAGFIVLD